MQGGNSLHGGSGNPGLLVLGWSGTANQMVEHEQALQSSIPLGKAHPRVLSSWDFGVAGAYR